jgi:hypothetical protein
MLWIFECVLECDAAIVCVAWPWGRRKSWLPGQAGDVNNTFPFLNNG